MNQILVSDKLIVTKELRRKKSIYKFNFFLSVFLACTLFSCYIYAEYDRNKSEQVSQEILVGLMEYDDMQEENENDRTIDDTTISVEDDILYVTLLADNRETTREVDITRILPPGTGEGTENTQSQETEQPKIVESVAKDGTKYYSEAILRIDKLDIEYPVLSDTSEELLKISLNKLWGPNPNQIGNYVIIGHNYKSGKMFGKLKRISIDDTVEIEDLLGRKVTYRVYDKYVIEPTDVSCTSQLTGGKREITLITCENSGKQRLVVKAVEI